MAGFVPCMAAVNKTAFPHHRLALATIVRNTLRDNHNVKHVALVSGLRFLTAA